MTMTDMLPPSEISSLSDAQDIAVTLLPIVPSLLSITGSSIIISLVVKSPKKSPYRRILLATSCCDILASITYSLNGFLVPAATSQGALAIGNDASCSALGFFNQFSFSAFFYSGMLSFYFLLTVRFGIKEATFAKRIEPWLHVVSLGYPLLTATIGAVLGFYHENELGQGCWVTDYPEGCGDAAEDAEECKSPLIGWVFGGLPIALILLCIAMNNCVIYLYVRRTINRGRRRSSFVTTGQDSQTKRIRAVATQAFLYVGAFLMTYLWGVVLKIMESGSYDAQDEATVFPILVLQATMLPLTGFFNLCIYVRPRYMRCRSDFPLESRWWAVRRALYEEAVPPTKTREYYVNTESSDEIVPPASASSAFMALGTTDSTKRLVENTNTLNPEHAVDSILKDKHSDVEDASGESTEHVEKLNEQ
jgi:hypothetical protein